MKTTKNYSILSILIGTIISFYACSNDDDSSTNSIDPIQPISVAPSTEFGGTIGFWDFNTNGDNSVLNESGHWLIDGVGYGDKGLVFDENINQTQARNSRVKLFNPSVSTQQGLHQRRYFSGAIKFKAEKELGEPFTVQLLSFGTNPRFLDLKIHNGKIQMSTQNSNIIKTTEIDVPDQVWNVLYFRLENFLPQSNMLYLQLNNNNEVRINLNDFNINEYANENDINLGFSSAGSIFKGRVDWVIISRGRMTPGNAQYLIDDFKN